MKVQKPITLTIEYESIDISQNWVAFNISKTLETTTYHSAITDRNTYNKYLENPFVIPTDNLITYGVVLIHPDTVSINVDFDTIVAKENCLFNFNFDFNVFKNNPTYCLFKSNVIFQKKYNYPNHDKLHYLTDFENNVVYFEHYIDLPVIPQTQENKHIFSCLYHLMQNNLFDIVPQQDSFHKTRQEYIDGFKNALDYVNDLSVAHFKISDCFTEFPNSLGTLTFKIENFNHFNDFFKLTKKYVELESCHLGYTCELDFNLILSLGLLKNYYSDIVHEDFFMLFPTEYNLAQSVFLDYKLKPKNNPSKIAKI